MKKYFATQLSDNISKTPEGFLICYNVPIARTGDMIYGDGESPIKVGPDGKAIVKLLVVSDGGNVSIADGRLTS